jgi:hypothetical protein
LRGHLLIHKTLRWFFICVGSTREERLQVEKLAKEEPGWGLDALYGEAGCSGRMEMTKGRPTC